MGIALADLSPELSAIRQLLRAAFLSQAVALSEVS